MSKHFFDYEDGDSVEKDVWYRLNVQPNVNQSSSEFMKLLANRLIFNGEALIIKVDNGDLFVAKDYTKKVDAPIRKMTFSQVTVDNYEDGTVQEYQLSGEFGGENAIFIRYTNAFNGWLQNSCENKKC